MISKRTLLTFAVGAVAAGVPAAQTMEKMEGSDALLGLRGLMVPPVARFFAYRTRR